MPSYGISGKKKHGIVGGLGVISDEILPRISDKVDIIGIGARYLRGETLPVYEEIDGYRVIRPLYRLDLEETLRRCDSIFRRAGVSFDGVHANEIPYLPFLADYTLAIPEILLKEKPDLICSHDWMAFLGSYEKSRRQGIPLAAFFHSLEAGRQLGIVHTPQGPVERQKGYYAGSRTIRDIEIIGLKTSDVCFTVGTNMVKELLESGKHHGVPPSTVKEKVFPLHHGVDTKIYRPIKGVEKEYDVIFIARFSPVKGAVELVQAVKILKKEYPDIKVKMIGGGELDKLIEELVVFEGLGGSITVSTEWYQPEEKAVEINKARIAVAPSKYEPHGQFDLEAGACGVPCIVGTGGFSERMIDGVTALQCDPFDPKDIAEKIRYLLERPEKAVEIGRNAREFIEKHYDWDERAKIYPEIFEAILDKDFKRLRELPLVVPLEY
jgi:glycosyltransferase involved in cell wall biosynthesis